MKTKRSLGASWFAVAATVTLLGCGGDDSGSETSGSSATSGTASGASGTASGTSGTFSGTTGTTTGTAGTTTGTAGTTGTATGTAGTTTGTAGTTGTTTGTAGTTTGTAGTTTGTTQTPDAGNGDAGDAGAGHTDAGEADAGHVDASQPDATVGDAGHEDAGEEDATVSDAGHADTGTPEDAGGTEDATFADAGHDAEAPPEDAGHDAAVDAGPATFTMIYETILNDAATADCKSCHNAALDRGGLDMGTTQATAYASLVGVEATGLCAAPGRIRVTPGDVLTSLLYNKVASKAPGGPAVECGAPMPHAPNPYVLTASQLAMIASWISAGAPND